MSDLPPWTKINKGDRRPTERVLVSYDYKDLEDNYGNEQYEVEFLGDLYARMIVSVYMGYFPEKMGKDAEEGATRLMKLSGVDMEEKEE